MAANDNNPTPTFQIETDLIKQGLGPVCGVDEAGRGPWSGPVVAAAVILNGDNIPVGINDSKKLKPKQREALFKSIHQTSHVGIGIVDVGDIDRLNILQATFLAMRLAVKDLKIIPATALIDGTGAPGLECEMHRLLPSSPKSPATASWLIWPCNFPTMAGNATKAMVRLPIAPGLKVLG